MGNAARKTVVERWSIDTMVRGYEDLIESIYARKVECRRAGIAERQSAS
jgi:hypothetical protein